MQVNTMYINSTIGTSSKKEKKEKEKKKKEMPAMAYIPPFQTRLVAQVCTGKRKNQFLLKIGLSPFISKLAHNGHFNTIS